MLRLKQAKLRPFVPSLAVTYSGADSGEARTRRFGNFGRAGRLRREPVLGAAGARPQRPRQSAESPRPQRQTADIDLVRVQAQVANDVVAAYKARAAAAAEAMDEARESVTEAIESLELNLTNIRRGAGLPGATRPIEVLQPIQALAQARTDYLGAVIAHNRAEFRLLHALGQPPLLPPPSEAQPTGR